MLAPLLAAGNDVPQEIILYGTADLCLVQGGRESEVKWQGHIFDRRDKYPAPGVMVKWAHSIFHGPSVESSFSLMNEIINPRSGNMFI